tara:strand:- start:230 stop:493 length:264 start_codon:yes stop_codon:yes gene_type:complete
MFLQKIILFLFLISAVMDYLLGHSQQFFQDNLSGVISHRLSILLHMDRILVFDQGDVVEDGAHKALFAQNKMYKKLWDAQVGRFLGG